MDAVDKLESRLVSGLEAIQELRAQTCYVLTEENKEMKESYEFIRSLTRTGVRLKLERDLARKETHLERIRREIVELRVAELEGDRLVQDFQRVALDERRVLVERKSRFIRKELSAVNQK